MTLLFLRNLRIPDPDCVLDGMAEVAIGSLKDDELYVLFSALAAALAARTEQDSFVDATCRLLELVRQVNKAERIDTVYAPLRQVARGQLLQQTLAAAHQQGRLPEVQRLVEGVFGGTPLTDYIQLMGSDDGV